MTQGDLAEGICNRSYISQIEKGLVIPTPEILEQLVRRLDIELNELWNESEQPTFSKQEIESTLRQLVNSIESHEWESAQKWVVKLGVLELSSPEVSVLSWAKGFLAQLEQRYQEAEKQYLEALILAGDYDDIPHLIRVLSSLGTLYCTAQEAKRALPYLNEALQLANRYEIGGLMRISLLHTHGLMHGMLGEYDSAIENLKEADQLNKSYRTHFKSEEIYMMLANCYHRLKQYEEAEQYNLHTLDILQFSPNPRIEAGVYSNLGVLYADLQKYDQAESMLLKAIEGHKQTESTHWLHNSTLELADVYRQTGRLEQAVLLCESVLASESAEKSLAEARYIYAEILTELGRGEDALSHLEPALEYFSQAKTTDFLVKAYRLLARISLFFGKFAYKEEFYQKHIM